MDAVDGRDALRFEPVGDALVGAEHELFDEAMRPAALAAHDGLHVAIGVELDDWLGEIEVDGAAAHALRIEAKGELEHAFKGLWGGRDLRALRVRARRRRRVKERWFAASLRCGAALRQLCTLVYVQRRALRMMPSATR